MLIAIIGTKCSGKSTLQDYLVQQKGFRPVYLASPSTNGSNGFLKADARSSVRKIGTITQERPVSFLVLHSPTTPLFLKPPATPPPNNPDLIFQSSADMLDFVTRNWLSDFVTVDLNTVSLLQEFRVRPFFLVLNVDAPILLRFHRYTYSTAAQYPLEAFLEEHDEYEYGSSESAIGSAVTRSFRDPNSAQHLNKLAHILIINNFRSVSAFYSRLDQLEILNPEILRPGWDTYFMQLADLASQRSNCMKRRVGAILVRNNRILATGYNGTPRGLLNCNEGGCVRCNTASDTSDECVCLHAEENALLEAGRERVGDGAVLYCNTCPCLKCTIKIIQTGVKEVVYSLSYKVDDASAALFKSAGVSLRRHAPS